jgi:hypothetical protein
LMSRNATASLGVPAWKRLVRPVSASSGVI